MRHRSLLISCAFFGAISASLHAQSLAEHGTAPAVAPDGRTIAFLSNRDGGNGLYVMNADGSNVRRLYGDNAMQGRPFWTRDGRHVMLAAKSGDTSVVRSYPLDGSTPVDVARIVAFPGGPVPFDDLSRFVYGVGTWRQTQLETARSDGTDRRRLSSDSATRWCASPSPSGDRIAVGRRDDVAWQIWVVNADGSDGHAITRFARADGSAECPRWSPDAKHVAFQNGTIFPADTTKRTSQIRIIDAAGGPALMIAPHAEAWQDELPSWFPDGKRLVFQSNRTGAWEIWTMNSDGSDQHSLTR